MGAERRIRIGIAGWSNPPVTKADRPSQQSHLAYYAAHFSCVEINSSFYRPHQGVTYARWRDETPAAFRFCVKMPRSITHEGRLQRCAGEIARFYEEVSHLRPKLAAILVQLPPSLEYDGRTARAFFRSVPRQRGIRVVCEPRHVSWFSSAAQNALTELKISRVAADPARHPGAQDPGGARRFAYFRWHGSPRMYYSKYSDAQLAVFANTVAASAATEIWCVFDNTARHAAWDNARRFRALLNNPHDDRQAG
jgi:uncharacterized protein YecE (DUF72 family)